MPNNWRPLYPPRHHNFRCALPPQPLYLKDKEDSDYLLVCCASALAKRGLALPLADDGAAQIVVEHALRGIERATEARSDG